MKNKLFSRDFSLVVVGQIISILGSAVLRFAVNLYILDVTGRADTFGLMVAVSAIPAVLFTPLGGAIADRFHRRNLMVIFDFSSSIVVLCLILLLSTGEPPIVVIGVILVLLSVISAMYQPTVQSSVPVLVGKGQLASGNGIVTGVGALSGLLGPVLGGTLYGIVGLRVLVAASCGAFFLSAVMEIFIRIPFTNQVRDKGMVSTIVGDMKQGMRYVVREKPVILKVLFLGAMLNMFMSPFFIVGVPYILRITLGSDETMYGIGMAISQLSAILGAVSVSFVTKKMTLSTTHRLLFTSSAAMLPIAFAVTPIFLRLGYWPPFVLLMVFIALIILFSTAISIFVVTSVQIVTPDDMLGKVMSIIMAIAQCAAPLGMALYGVAFEMFSEMVYIPALLAAFFTATIAFIARKTLKGSDAAVGQNLF